jgi:hypothetical protein
MLVPGSETVGSAVRTGGRRPCAGRASAVCGARVGRVRGARRPCAGGASAVCGGRVGRVRGARRPCAGRASAVCGAGVGRVQAARRAFGAIRAVRRCLRSARPSRGVVVRVRVAALAAVTILSMPSPAHAAVPGMLYTGTPYTSGSNSFGELGSAGAANRSRPVRWADSPTPSRSTAVGNTSSRYVPAAPGGPGVEPVRPARQRFGRESSHPGQVNGLSGVTQVTTGHYHRWR